MICENCRNEMNKIIPSVYWCSCCGTVRLGRRAVITWFRISVKEIELPQERLDILKYI